jgi:hypothetical protein
MNLRIIPYLEKQTAFELFHGTGGAGLTDTGFLCMDKIWKFAADGVTDITGRPHSGKTEFALEILFYQAESHGKRFFLYVPDIGNYNEIRRKLIVKYYKRSFRGYPNSLQKHELVLAASWIDAHFLILGKAELTKPITPEMLYDFTATWVDDDYKGVDGILIDSWKNLLHSYNGREDVYLDYILQYRNEIAEGAKKHIMTIAHPNKMPKDENGKRKIPDAEDIKGGGWFAAGKTIVSVDRPEKNSELVDIHFSKVKPDTLGKAESIIGELEFYWKHSRYRETINGVIYYAGEAKKEIKQTEFTPPPF